MKKREKNKNCGFCAQKLEYFQQNHKRNDSAALDSLVETIHLWIWWPLFDSYSFECFIMLLLKVRLNSFFSLARFCLCPILALLPFVRLILILILILMTESAVKFMIWSVKFCTMTSYKISFYFCIAEAVVKEIRSDMNSCFTKLVTDLQICISKFVIHSVSVSEFDAVVQLSVSYFFLLSFSFSCFPPSSYFSF